MVVIKMFPTIVTLFASYFILSFSMQDDLSPEETIDLVRRADDVVKSDPLKLQESVEMYKSAIHRGTGEGLRDALFGLSTLYSQPPGEDFSLLLKYVSPPPNVINTCNIAGLRAVVMDWRSIMFLRHILMDWVMVLYQFITDSKCDCYSISCHGHDILGL
jgi:hypothetical protein